MKNKYLLLVLSGIVLNFTACIKSNSGTNTQVDGKWRETKLRIYGDSSGSIIYDTTYTKPFTAADYIQFNNNGTCDISQDHYYYPNIDNYPKTPQLIPTSVGAWNYSALGNAKYLLSYQTQLTNPGGFEVADTVEVLSSNTLLLHVVFYSHQPDNYQISDSYYQK